MSNKVTIAFGALLALGKRMFPFYGVEEGDNSPVDEDAVRTYADKLETSVKRDFRDKQSNSRSALGLVDQFLNGIRSAVNKPSSVEFLDEAQTVKNEHYVEPKDRPSTYDVLRQIADGKYQLGQGLLEKFGVTRMFKLVDDQFNIMGIPGKRPNFNTAMVCLAYSFEQWAKDPNNVYFSIDETLGNTFHDLEEV